MARIELKYCTIRFQDGLKGTAVGPTTRAGCRGDQPDRYLGGAQQPQSDDVSRWCSLPHRGRDDPAGPYGHCPRARHRHGRGERDADGGGDQRHRRHVQAAVERGRDHRRSPTTRTPSTVAAALAPLVGATANVAVTGTLGSWTVTFQGTLANSPQPF